MGKYFHVRESKWTQDFRAFNLQDSAEYGVTYSATKQVWITLHRHESMENIINTVNHEALHQAIREDIIEIKDRVGDVKIKMDESENMDGEQEHELMKRVIWAENDWLF
jgi:hypothetical protein